MIVAMENSFRDSPTSILHLPDDCLYFIFKWLDSAIDRESFGLTCHRFLQIQNSNRLSLQFKCSFTQLSISSLSQNNIKISSTHVHRLLSRFQQLQSLSLSGCVDLSDGALSQLKDYGSGLRSLYLDCCFGITDDGFLLVASGCAALKTISLCRCNISDTGLESLAKFCFALQDVDLSYCSLISDKGLRALSQNCHHLRAIKISHCRSISGVGFNGCSQTLAYLEAEFCKLEPNGISSIVSGGGLEYLNLSNLSWCIHGNGLMAIGAGLARALRIVNFRMCRTIIDESITAISRGCPLLEEWNLALCHEIKILGWESIGLNCRNLKKLHVNRCRNFCDRGLRAIMGGCQRLAVLYISRCCQVTPATVDIFIFSRGDVEIQAEEITCIAPDWAFKP